MTQKLLVAIDGPAGSGKTTIAKQVAQRLHYTYIDTGAMYRAITLKILRQGIDPGDEKKSVEIAKRSRIRFKPNKKEQQVFIDGEDVTQDIRSHQVNEHVSLISSYKGVRQHLVKEQQRMAKNGGVVMEGRDIGTVVLPFAKPKIYLTASPKERAKRRYNEMKKKDMLHGKTLEEIEATIKERDHFDSNRKESPLAMAPDAIEVDTTHLNISQVLEVLIDIVKRSSND